MASISELILERARALSRARRMAGAMALGIGLAGAAQAGPINEDRGLGLKGYDPVAYVEQQEAVTGSPDITATHDGVIYRFASPDHRARFSQAPARFLPQYGGFCAFGTAGGYKADIDPKAFAVVDGKLYLNYSLDVQAKWKADIAGFIRKADEKWPEVKATEQVYR